MASRSLINLATVMGQAAEARALIPGALQQFSSVGGVAQYKLPDLPYEYAALEPYISGQIMELHHKKHHQTYVTNVNKALEQWAEASSKNDLAGMISLQGAINFNGGGACRRAPRVAPPHARACMGCDGCAAVPPAAASPRLRRPPTQSY